MKPTLQKLLRFGVKVCKYERWKPIKGEWGMFYAVSNYGNVVSLERTVKGWKRPVTRKQRMIKPMKHTKSGMLIFRAYVEGRYKVFFIHRLVADLFIKRRKSDPYDMVDFIDGNFENCRADNLRWAKTGDLIKQRLKQKKETK